MVSGSMIYEVLLKVDAVVEARVMKWLTPHVRQMLTFDGFESARINRQADVRGPQVHLSVQYVLKDRSYFERYEAHDAARMRAEGLEAFPTGLSAVRSMWQVCGEFESLS